MRAIVIAVVIATATAVIAIVLISIIDPKFKGEQLNIKESRALVKYDMIEADMRYVIYSNTSRGGVDIINVTLDSLRVY